jgi:hypothetical protein
MFKKKKKDPYSIGLHYIVILFPFGTSKRKGKKFINSLLVPNNITTVFGIDLYEGSPILPQYLFRGAVPIPKKITTKDVCNIAHTGNKISTLVTEAGAKKIIEKAAKYGGTIEYDADLSAIIGEAEFISIGVHVRKAYNTLNNVEGCIYCEEQGSLTRTGYCHSCDEQDDDFLTKLRALATKLDNGTFKDKADVSLSGRDAVMDEAA